MLKLLPVIVIALCASLAAQDRSQSRSMVMSTAGIVATESVLASQVGARILESGGNAIDAADCADERRNRRRFVRDYLRSENRIAVRDECLWLGSEGFDRGLL